MLGFKAAHCAAQCCEFMDPQKENEELVAEVCAELIKNSLVHPLMLHRPQPEDFNSYHTDPLNTYKSKKTDGGVCLPTLSPSMWDKPYLQGGRPFPQQLLDIPCRSRHQLLCIVLLHRVQMLVSAKNLQ